LSEFLASWIAGPVALRAEEADLRPGLGLGLALAALACMTLPAAVGLLVLLGSLR
jgi:hypothetical protein